MKVYLIGIYGIVLANCLSAEIIRFDSEQIVYDTDTKLFWQDNSDAKAVEKKWIDANAYCKNLTLSNFNDWYLPTENQLKNIASQTKKGNQNFRNFLFDQYWSSTDYEKGNTMAWGVDFKNNISYYSFKSDYFYVRCTRDGQLSDTLPNSVKKVLDSLEQKKKKEAEAKRIREENAKIEQVNRENREYDLRQARIKKDLAGKKIGTVKAQAVKFNNAYVCNTKEDLFKGLSAKETNNAYSEITLALLDCEYKSDRVTTKGHSVELSTSSWGDIAKITDGQVTVYAKKSNILIESELPKSKSSHHGRATVTFFKEQDYKAPVGGTQFYSVGCSDGTGGVVSLSDVGKNYGSICGSNTQKGFNQCKPRDNWSLSLAAQALCEN